MNFLVCALTNRPTSSAVLNKRNRLTYDKKSLEEWLEQTTVCPVSKIEISKSDLVAIKPEFSADDYVFSNGSLPYIDLLLSDHVNYLLEKKKAEEQIQILGSEIANELLEQQACQQVIAELEQKVQAYRQEIDQMREEMSEKFQTKSIADFKAMVSKLYSSLVEKNKSLRRGVKPSDKETIWKFKSFSTDKYLLPKEIQFCFYSNEGRYALFIDNEKKLILVDSQKNCILDSTEPDFVINDHFDCSVIEHPEHVHILILQDNRLWKIGFAHATKKFVERSERFSIDQKPISQLQMHPSNAFFVTFSRNRLVFLDANTLGTIATTKVDSEILELAVHPDGKLILLSLASKPETIQFFDLLENKVMTSFTANEFPISKMCFSSDRFHFFVYQNCMTFVIDIRKLEAVYSFSCADARSVRFNGSGNLLSVLFDDHLEIHFPKFKQRLSSIDLPALGSLDFEFVPQGNGIRVVCKNSVVGINFIE